MSAPLRDRETPVDDGARWLDASVFGGSLPPPPHNEPDDDAPRPDPTPRRLPANNDRIFHHGWTFAFISFFAILGVLNLTTIAAGARGGYLAVAALALAFGVVCFVPFIAGALWLKRYR